MKKSRIALTTGALLLLAVTAVLWVGMDSRGLQATDDAYVQADMTRVAPRVSGLIHQVAVEDYQAVEKGDLLFTLDDQEFRIALRQAQAEVDSAQADIRRIEQLLDTQENSIRQAEAVLAVDEANLRLAQANQTRFSRLAEDGSGTEQDREEAGVALDVQQATRERDQQVLQAARKQIGVLQSRLEMARATLQGAQARRDRAALELSWTRVTAPVSGVVGQRLMRVGAHVNAGQALVTLVPLEQLYIEANYRETQLQEVHPGQPVSFQVDALPGIQFRGEVERLGPASGVSFSPVAPHNATGNFTKIVQRLPVRIRIDRTQPEVARLRVGMSVRPEIDTDH